MTTTTKCITIAATLFGTVACGGTEGDLSADGATASPEDAVRAMVVFNSCSGHGFGREDGRAALYEILARSAPEGQGAPRPSGGGGVVVHLLPRLVPCVLGAGGDCDAVFACFNRRERSNRCDSDDTWRCEDEVLRGCGAFYAEAREVAVNCGATGRRCLPAHADEEIVYAACAEASCEAPEANRCEGHDLVRCLDGVRTRFDCTLRGQVCGSLADRAHMDIGCHYDGPACDEATFEPRCEGHVVALCRDGIESRFDCAAVLGGEFTCRIDRSDDGIEFAACVARDPLGPACSPGTFNRRCDEIRIVHCLLGYESVVDCAALGFTGCDWVGEGLGCVR